MKFRVLDEMAHDRADIMIKCQSLGELFIEHFHKLYSEGKDSSDFVHHCHEMQVWLDKGRKLKLKSTGRVLTPSSLIDWFFTAAGNIDEDNGFYTYEEIDAYNEFMLALAANKESNVYDVAMNVLY